MKTDREIIEVNEEIEIFKDYLDEDTNQRIIFSGIFGAGKTTFLRKFFKTHKSEYTVLHLFPTNYSVVSNEDIFRLIKYDLLYEIISHKPLLEETSINLTDSIGALDPNEQWQIIRSLIEAVPQIGKPVSVLIKSLNNVIEVVKANKAKFDKSESSLIKDFIDDMESGNSLYENDAYTKLIIDLTKRLKEDGKKVILVIDDLDRIDPDHIFRILNVFAVHFDVSTKSTALTSNKFNLDQIILCCDIENIRNIFAHRYGALTDFNGYIDKFYSSGIYFFDLKQKLISRVKKVVRSIKFSEQAGAFIFLGEPDTIHYKNLEALLISMILSNKLSTRDFVRFGERKYKVPVYNLLTKNHENYANWQFPAITIFDFLVENLGGISKVKNIVNNCFISETVNAKYLLRLEADLCLILERNNLESFHVESFQTSLIKHNGEPVTIIIDRHNRGAYTQFYCSHAHDTQIPFRSNRFQEILAQAFEVYIILSQSHEEPSRRKI